MKTTQDVLLTILIEGLEQLIREACCAEEACEFVVWQQAALAASGLTDTEILQADPLDLPFPDTSLVSLEAILRSMRDRSPGCHSQLESRLSAICDKLGLLPAQ